MSQSSPSGPNDPISDGSSLQPPEVVVLAELTGEALSGNRYRQQWEIVRLHRIQIADEIDNVSRGLVQSVGVFQKLAKWFRGSATYEEALPQASVMSISLPLLKMLDGDKTSFSPEEIRQAVFAGVQELLSHPGSTGWRLFRSLLYPMVMMLFAWLVWFIASVWYIPQIKRLFEDFGLSLPKVTQLVFYTGDVLSQFRYSLPMVAILFCGLFFLLNRMGGHRFGSDTSWIDKKLTRSRTALAAWARHVAMLIEWGIPSKTAILCAGVASQKGWLQRRSIAWVTEPARETTVQPISDPDEEYYRGKPNPSAQKSMPRKFFPEARYQLLNYAVSLPDSPVKVQLLREAANYYWEHSRSSLDWIGKFFSVLTTWTIMGFIVLIVLSIFLPLVRLITGLTGGPPAGGGGGGWLW